MKKYILSLVLCLLVVLGLASCANNKKTIVVGTMAQPGEPILEYVKEKFEEQSGYKLEIQIYTDFATPNNALAGGEIQANLFQHKPYLDTYNEVNSTDLVSASIMYDCAYAGYTKKSITSLDDIPNGSKITIANDASNMKRCLDILNASGIITVDYGTTSAAELNPDNVNTYITANPKSLVISPMSTSLIAASLDDSTTYLGIVNATFAIAANLGTTATKLCEESDPEHKNANILAVASADKDADWLKTLVEILESKDTDDYIKAEFGSVITPYHG